MSTGLYISILLKALTCLVQYRPEICSKHSSGPSSVMARHLKLNIGVVTSDLLLTSKDPWMVQTFYKWMFYQTHRHCPHQCPSGAIITVDAYSPQNEL